MSALPHPSDERQHRENIFQLFSQINYISLQLGKEEDSSLKKIKDVFKTHNEISTIKQGISQNVEELIEHGPEKIKEELHQLKSQWNKIKPNLQDEKEISTLLRSSTQALKEQMDRVINKSFRIEFYPTLEGDQPDRITSAVQPYFETISETTLVEVEEKYPKTMTLLFDVAFRLQEGSYGKRLSEIFGFSAGSVSSPEILISLLVIDLSRTYEGNLPSEPPEIFEKIKENHSVMKLFNELSHLEINQIEKLILHPAEEATTQLCPSQLIDFYLLLKIPRKDLSALLQIFHKIVANLANPTSQLIDLLLHMSQLEKAITYAKLIPQLAEQSKSLLNIALYLLNKNDFSETMKIVRLIKSPSEKSRSVFKVIEKLLDFKQVDQAISFAQSLNHSLEVDYALEVIAIQLTERGKVAKALEITLLMRDSDLKSYSLSRIVNILASKALFRQAIEIALMIDEQGFREDSFGYIVKRLLNLRRVDEAIQFVEMIPNPKEKNFAAKIVESAMVAYHEDEKVKKVRNLFSLMKSPVRL